MTQVQQLLLIQQVNIWSNTWIRCRTKLCDTDLASIFYTDDGTDPDTSATRQYTTAIHLTATTTLKFIGYDNFDNAGAPGEETYTLDNTGPTVTASPPGGTFGAAGTQ